MTLDTAYQPSNVIDKHLPSENGTRKDIYFHID